MVDEFFLTTLGEYDKIKKDSLTMRYKRMHKEKLTLFNIKYDLHKVASFKFSNASDWRFSYIVPITLLAIMIGVLTKSILIGLLIFSFAVYHIVLYIPSCKEYFRQKKAIKEAIDRRDISISAEKLSHIGTERIYEPHMGGRSIHKFKDVKFYYFVSGTRWRLPIVYNRNASGTLWRRHEGYKHYGWSKEYYLSSEGLQNISVEGNEFYYISLQGHYDIAYIYPRKIFELDADLKN